MRNYFRCLKQAWPYRHRLILSGLAAVCVSLLWSLNLSAIYPVLKVLSTEDNLQQWVDKEIEAAGKVVNDPVRQAREKQLDAEIARLSGADQPAAFDRENSHLRKCAKELATLKGENETAASRMYWYQWLRDKVIRFLPENRFQTFAWIMGAVIAGVVLKGFFEFWQDALVGGVVCRVLFDLRNRFYQAVVHQDIRQLQDAGTPELMARLTNDVEQIGSGMKVLFGKMVVEPLKMAGCVVAACLISWQLTVLFLVLVAPAALVLGRVSRLMKKAARKVLERMSGIYKILRETFDGVKVVKAFTMEPAERRRFRRANEDYYRRSVRVITIDAFAGPMVEVLGVAAVGVALLAGAYLVMEKTTTIFGIPMTDRPLGFAELLLLYAYLAAIADPVRRLSSVYTKVQGGAVAADRVFALADRVPAVAANGTGPQVPRHAKSIEFRNVCFSYVPGQDRGTLNNVDLIVKAGETVAVVGPNGCGKSTLLGLLARFHDPDLGAVYVDGMNLRKANLRSLRRQIGLVTQDTVLFADTIRNNIAYGRPGATPSEVEAAAEKAFVHEFAADKPKRYDEEVGDLGSQLSGGQKQRIALARAILRDPRILILDEFTSQIDAESEQKIHQALKEFVRGRTTFVVTHRLSTLELADRIVVMDGGRVVGVGRHPELVATCPTYQRLYEAQILGQTAETERKAA